MNNSGKSTLSLLAGVAIGAGIGLLLAPKSGKELRDELSVKADGIKNDLMDVANKKIATIRDQVEKQVDHYTNKKNEFKNDIKNEVADSVNG